MFGLVTSFTNIPPFAAPVPLSSIILSPKVIVVESIVVVVPCTFKSPSIVTFDESKDIAVLNDCVNEFKFETLVFKEAVVSSILSNLSVRGDIDVVKEPESNKVIKSEPEIPTLSEFKFVSKNGSPILGSINVEPLLNCKIAINFFLFYQIISKIYFITNISIRKVKV